MLTYGLIMTALWIGVAAYLLWNSRKLEQLSNVNLVRGEEPSLVIIVAIRNEEVHVREAMERLCRIEYKHYRVLAINDRSTDRTPEILEELAEIYPHFSYVSIKELPKGWLGKNHAMYTGVMQSVEPWILFTDADVLFSPKSISRAMQFAQGQRLDHLTILPEVESPSRLFSSVLETFKVMLELQQKPWLAKDPSSPSSLGVGAFNLVRRKAYERSGTHKLISLRPDDDLQLGKLIKRSGGRQDVLYGDGEITLEWYNSLSAFVKGLMKNTFSVFDYQLSKVMVASALTVFVFILPIPLLLTGNATEKVMALIIFLAQASLYCFKKGMSRRWWYVLMIPLAGAIMTYITIVSAFKTLKQGGIYWRETFYPLEQLRKQKSIDVSEPMPGLNKKIQDLPQRH